jgi:hypothetical protein
MTEESEHFQARSPREQKHTREVASMLLVFTK